MPNVKYSFGIACFRKNTDGLFEILLINKRYTYAFCEFVHGAYDGNNDYSILRLLNKMTFEEKIKIQSFDFYQIWYWVWLNDVSGDRYRKAKHIFDSTFCSPYGQSRLSGLIARASSEDRIWEMPKGRRSRIDGTNETDVECAIREFCEETRFIRKDFELIAGRKKKSAYTDDGVKYVSTYFLAIARHAGDALTLADKRGQFREICNARWVTLADVHALDVSGRLVETVRPLFSYMKKYYKGI